MSIPNIPIAVRVRNPKALAGRVGECAGDYAPDECQWWIGTPTEMVLSATRPAGAREIRAMVKHAGGTGWLAQPRKSGKNRVPRMPDRFRAGWTETSEVSGVFAHGWRHDPRWAVMAYRQFRALWMAPLPLP